MTKMISLAGALFVAALAAPAFAAESADDFQLYVLRDLKLDGQTINGRVAVGRNATFTSSSIGGATAGLPSSLVVGGDLTFFNGGSIAGQALVGGADKTPAYMPVDAGLLTLPVDFTAENLRLQNLSQTLAAYKANGTATLQYGGLYLTGLDTGLNVFSIDAKDLSKVTWFNANIASGSQVLINVTGNNANLSGGLNFYQASNILWNFADANQISAGSVSIGGSILAPNASFTGKGGTISGDLVTGDFKGAMSFGNASYAGNLLKPPSGPAKSIAAIPEPGTWAMMILGFGAIGAVLRRRWAQVISADA